MDNSASVPLVAGGNFPPSSSLPRPVDLTRFTKAFQQGGIGHNLSSLSFIIRDFLSKPKKKAWNLQGTNIAGWKMDHHFGWQKTRISIMGVDLLVSGYIVPNICIDF